jgi:carboxyl-terminal processing protease
MTKKFGLIAIVIILCGAIFGGLFGRLPGKSAASDALSPQKISADYQEALSVIDKNYATKTNYEKLLESSIQGMLWTLDPHSSFFSAAEFRKLYEDQSSRFFGIGVSILLHGEGARRGVYVQAIVPNTPAERAGLRYGDRFLEVDGKDAMGWTSAEVSRNVRGEQGTVVNLKIERAGLNKPLDFQIVRGGVPYPSIRNRFLLKDGTGYIGFTGGFQETSSAELDEAIAALKQQGMKQLILDLRGNPGGLLPQAVEVTSRFVPRGQAVVSIKGRSRYARNEVQRATGKKLEDFPLVVLINGGSASASEIVAGALQDYGRALIVGSDSFGKGLVQRVFPLPNGTGLTLTTARYYTPFGRALQRDYSSGSIYDYYTNRNEEGNGNGVNEPSAPPKPKGSPVTVTGGRILYGGQGLSPDIKAPALAFTTLRFRINEAAFFFTRQLVAGKIEGFENFKVDRQDSSRQLQASDFQISDKLFEAFLAFVERDSEDGLTVENLKNQVDHAKARLRSEIATAHYSGEAGQQVLLEVDPQILKAVEVMPDAKKLLEDMKNIA